MPEGVEVPDRRPHHGKNKIRKYTIRQSDETIYLESSKIWSSKHLEFLYFSL